MLTPFVAAHRADLCADCPTPCQIQGDAVILADPCARCPLERPRWSQWDCVEATPLGDTLAQSIREHLLEPARRHAPGLVASVESCGGCTQAKHALGSRDRHPEADAQVV